MAAGNVTNRTLTRNTPAEYPAMTAIDATDGAYITAAADDRMLIILTVTAAGTITLKKGDAKWGAQDDLAVTFSAAGTKIVAVESARYVITSGTNRGKIKLTGSGTAGCVVLP